MTDTAADPEDVPRKTGKFALMIWLILALCGAGAGFAAVSFGFLPPETMRSGQAKGKDQVPNKELGDLAFVEVDPIMISLNQGTTSRQLRFRAKIEVDSGNQYAVEQIMPRIVDVLNGYLRALTLEDLTDPLALTRLRAQMLRRISIVTGEVPVRDLLVMEFVLN